MSAKKTNNNDYARYQAGSEVARFHLYPKYFGDALDEQNNIPTNSQRYHDWIMYLVNSPDDSAAAPEHREASPMNAYTRHLLDVLQKVKDITLESTATAKDELSLKQAQENIKQDIKKVLTKISEYVMTAHQLEEVAHQGDKEEITRRDLARRLAHNALIADLNIANRSLFWSFGKIRSSSLPPAQQDMYRKQKQAGLIPTHISTTEWPPNGFCPESINPAHSADREKITFWSVQIYEDLRVLEEALMTTQ